MTKVTDPQHVRARITSRVAIEDRGYTTPCWISNRTTHRNGYTSIFYAGRNRLTHRLSYMVHIGPIPDGLVIDHLCRQRACANPDHLEPVTQRINLIRGEGFIGRLHRQTHCVRGHELSGDNLYRDPRGQRQCRTCRREANRRACARRVA